MYLEGGAYTLPGSRALDWLGVDPADPGDIAGLAPYGRVAWQGAICSGIVEIGAFGLQARIHPGRDPATGLSDRYTDLGLDASYFATLGGHGDVLGANARYVHESRDLAATCALADADRPCGSAGLTDLRFDIAYYWHNTIGGTVAIFNTSGDADPIIFPDNRTHAPSSTGMIFQIDGTPFGGKPQPARLVQPPAGSAIYRFHPLRRYRVGL